MSKLAFPPLGVALVGYTQQTQVVPMTYEMAGSREQRDSMNFNVESLPEYAGRVCYDAFGRYNKNTASARGYMHNILKQKHFSVLEHSTISLDISGISRSVSHELVRHRHFSFSQESQRYVRYDEELPVVVPPAIRGNKQLRDQFVAQCEAAHDEYISILNGLGDLPRKQAAEAARGVLPGATATRIVVTGNLRSWMEFIDKRLSKAADAEMQLLAESVLGTLEIAAPDIFDEESRKIWQGGEEHGAARA